MMEELEELKTDKQDDALESLDLKHDQFIKLVVTILGLCSALVFVFATYGAYKFTQRSHDREVVKELKREVNRNEDWLHARNKDVEKLKQEIYLMHQAQSMENLLVMILDKDQHDELVELEKYIENYKSYKRKKDD